MFSKQHINEFFWSVKIFRKKIKLYIKNSFNRLKFCFFPVRKDKFELKKIKKILIARNDKIGDMIVTTPILKNLALSGYEVYVSSQKGSLEAIKYNPHVKGFFIYDDSSLLALYKTIKAVRKQHFDLVIDVRPYYAFEMSKIIFCAFTNSMHLMGFNKSNIKSYNISIPYYDNRSHITNQFKEIFQYLDINDYDMSYDLHVKEENDKYVDDFINKNNLSSGFVIINPFGGARKRELSKWQMEYIVSLLKEKKPDYKIIFIGESNKLNEIDFSLGMKFRSNSILDVVSLIKRASFVVSVDTSIVHITAAFSIPCVTIYSESIFHEDTNDINLKMRKKWNEYYRNECNNLVDKKYLVMNNLSVELPYCYENLWGPNNKNAKQVVFYKSFIGKVDNEEFAHKVSSCFE